jgi:hypothetical protein
MAVDQAAALSSNFAPSARLRRAREHGLPAWWREAIMVLVIYAAYDTTRGLRHSSATLSQAHGRTILHGEQTLHIAPEHLLNQLLWHAPVVAVLASYAYATLHYLVTPAVLIWMYLKQPGHYRTARTVLAISTIIALFGYWFYPAAPPRLLPDSGFHDTLADVSGWGWWASEGSVPRGLGSLANQLAAMPSLHVGWALWAGWLVARYAKRTASRILGAAYPVLTTFVVVATANHYLLDAVAGAAVLAVPALLVAVGARLRRRRPRITAATEKVFTRYGEGASAIRTFDGVRLPDGVAGSADENLGAVGAGR